MTMRLWLLVMVVSMVAGCASGPSWRGLPKQLPSEKVVDRDACISVWRCSRFAPYYRVEDGQIGRINWLLSDQHHACVVSDADFVSVSDNVQYACVWRQYRTVVSAPTWP